MEQAVDLLRVVIKLIKRHLPRCDRMSRWVLQSIDPAIAEMSHRMYPIGIQQLQSFYTL